MHTRSYQHNHAHAILHALLCTRGTASTVLHLGSCKLHDDHELWILRHSLEFLLQDKFQSLTDINIISQFSTTLKIVFSLPRSTISGTSRLPHQWPTSSFLQILYLPLPRYLSFSPPSLPTTAPLHNNSATPQHHDTTIVISMMISNLINHSSKNLSIIYELYVVCNSLDWHEVNMTWVDQ